MHCKYLPSINHTYVRTGDHFNLPEGVCVRFLNSILGKGRREVVLVIASRPYSTGCWCACIDHIYGTSVSMAIE